MCDVRIYLNQTRHHRRPACPLADEGQIFLLDHLIAMRSALKLNILLKQKTELFGLPISNIHKVTFNGCCCCHFRAYKVCTTALALSAFKVSIRC